MYTYVCIHILLVSLQDISISLPNKKLGLLVDQEGVACAVVNGKIVAEAVQAEPERAEDAQFESLDAKATPPGLNPPPFTHDTDYN